MSVVEKKRGNRENLTMAGSFKTREVDPVAASAKGKEAIKKNRSVAEALKLLLNQEYKVQREDKVTGKITVEEQQGWDILATKLYFKAVESGDIKAMKLLIERIEGQPKLPIDLPDLPKIIVRIIEDGSDKPAKD